MEFYPIRKRGWIISIVKVGLKERKGRPKGGIERLALLAAEPFTRPSALPVEPISLLPSPEPRAPVYILKCLPLTLDLESSLTQETEKNNPELI